MDYTVLVDQAVKQFYSNGNNDVHLWLLQVQTSKHAWTFVWQLLQPSKSWEVQFFAATTLHTKISRHWDEVPEDEYPVLRERLLNCIKQPNIPKFILSKLCQALAAYLANVSGMENEEHNKNVVVELMDMLPSDSLPKLELLLLTLSLLPVEFGRKYEAKRCKLHENLVNGWYKTTWFLQQVFSMCNPNTPGSDLALHLLAMECALFWLKVGSQLPLEATGQIYHHLLVAAAYYAPCRNNAEEENSKGWEVVHECLNTIVNHGELLNRPQTLWDWAHSLVSMARQYNGKYFCEILTAIGEPHSRSFLRALVEDVNEMQRSTSEGLIELLLQCSEQGGRYPIDETRSCIPFGFWFSLQDDIGTLDQPYENRALLVLRPVYARLAHALLRKSTLPVCPSEAGDANERELFRCYRQDVADTLDYCYRVLGEDLLILLGQRLSRTLDGMLRWAEVESTLHAFEALADSVDIQESHYIPALMDLVICHIPYDLYPGEVQPVWYPMYSGEPAEQLPSHPPIWICLIKILKRYIAVLQVLACVCTALGRYAEWIGMHPHPWLERVLHIITMGLTRGSLTAPLASMALKDLVRECEPHLTPFAPSILNIIERTLPTVTPGCPEGLRLMSAAGKLLNTLSTIDEKIAHLDATLGLCIIKIKQLLDQPLFVARSAVTSQLKMATMFFSALECSIGKSVLDGLLPVFNQIIGHPEWSQDNATLEEMYTCAQKSLLSLLHPEVDTRPLLPILTTSYKNWPHPAALDLLRQLVLLLGRDPENVIGRVFAELSSVTLSGVRACRSVPGNLSDWAELMESYLRLLAQTCKKNPKMLLQVLDQIPEMLQCGMDCLMLPENETVKAAGSFLSHAIMPSTQLERFIQPIGQQLVFVVMQCVGGKVPRNSLDPHAEVLVALNKEYVKWMSSWLRDAIEKLPGQFLVPQVQKNAFVSQVVKERKKQQMSEILKEFSLQNLAIKRNTGCIDQSNTTRS